MIDGGVNDNTTALSRARVPQVISRLRLWPTPTNPEPSPGDFAGGPINVLVGPPWLRCYQSKKKLPSEGVASSRRYCSIDSVNFRSETVPTSDLVCDLTGN